MAKKITLTRPELKRRRDMLARFERYLPTLKLKQQQLQMTLRDVAVKRTEALDAADRAKGRFTQYENILSDRAGVDLRTLSTCENIRTETINVAGVRVPVFEGADFPPAAYSLFATPPWVDQTLADLRQISTCRAQGEVLNEEYRLLDHELTKIIQRVNLFEKVMIPECSEVIRVIRIKLGDEQTAGVARGKMAKTRLAESEAEIYRRSNEQDQAEAQAV